MTINWARLRDEWLGNIRGDLLAGVVVALALIPEAIAFSVIAGFGATSSAASRPS